MRECDGKCSTTCVSCRDSRVTKRWHNELMVIPLSLYYEMIASDASQDTKDKLKKWFKDA